MNGVFKKTIFSILSICLLSSFSLAVENEFKNSLTKVELTKTGENSYNVNLYTQKKYSEPVKVIKKSDLNYYILLPETKNSAVQITSNNQDIRNVSTNLYPYAGADSNNGYTKININTSKPINFTINTKNNQTAKAPTQKQTIATNTTKENAEVQKKNSVSSNASKITLAPKAQTKNIPQNTNKPLEKKSTAPAEKTIKTPIKQVQNTTKINQNTTKKEIKKPTLAVEKTSPKPKIEEIIQQEIIEQQTENVAPLAEEIEEGTQAEEENLIDENNTINDIENNKQFSITNIKSILYSLKTKIQNKLNHYGLNIKELLLMTMAAFISFFAMLLILNRKPNNPKLKSKVDLIDSDSYQKTDAQKPKKENNGQYFIFDNNVKQRGFYDPLSSTRKNYELSSYEPDLVKNYHKTKIENMSFEDDSRNEYEIIQKILKEDSIIEFTPNEFNNSNMYTLTPKKTAQKPTEKKEETSKHAKNPIQKAQPAKKQIADPVVLSSIEIAPERGFMCVSYNDNINLLGYIFDDVFALYNFRQPKLTNYNIKFRLTEKNDKGANFIVKVENTKMLIKVTKTSMNLEVVM